MTKQKLISEYETKIESFDDMINQSNESLAKIRKGERVGLTKDDLLDIRTSLLTKRQIYIQVIEDIKSLKL
ncbi:MAG: hypothetical protein COA36_16910 [Desulfotalea sp.]|nr:MAG: hypothetical protein COA36_16910 [Desulfotalea sp.]